MGATFEHEVDHINGDGLDNRRSNLRLCNRSQNGANRVSPNREIKYRGVYKSKNGNGFKAQIKAFRRNIHIGVFDTEEDAARAYDAKAREYFGEFARTNF